MSHEAGEIRDTLPAWLGPLLITIVVMIGYGFSPARLPLVGEETCRAQHGIEMADTGDWLIPTQQGVEIIDRPPGQYWFLAAIHKWIHPLDATTLRVSAVLVLLATSLMIWWYTRQFTLEAYAILAGVAYPTMGHVFDLGRRVETDSLFTLVVAASLLVWHAGHTGRWRPIVTWTLACAIAALAALVKGIQAPVAFFGAIYVYLLLRREFKSLVSWAHMAGLGVFVGLIALWHVPFYLVAGWEGTRETWLTPSTSRMGASTGGLLEQLVTFPGYVIGASLPWSAALIGLLDPRIWKMDSHRRSSLFFLFLAMGMIFGPVWITESGHHRYVMPMYPLMCAAVGLIFQRCHEFELPAMPRRFSQMVMRGTSLIVLGAGPAFIIVTIIGKAQPDTMYAAMAQPWWLNVVILLGGTATGLAIFKLATSSTQRDVVLTAFLSAASLAVIFNGPVMNATVSKAESIGPDVRAIRELADQQGALVSFGPVHHKFVYWYEDPIPIIDLPTSRDDLPPGTRFFAVDLYQGEWVDLPFDWEQVAVLNMDRTVQEEPEIRVLVGRVLD